MRRPQGVLVPTAGVDGQRDTNIGKTSKVRRDVVLDLSRVVEALAVKEEVVDARAILDPRMVRDVVVFVVDGGEVLVDRIPVAVVVVQLGGEECRGCVVPAPQRRDCVGRIVAADRYQNQNQDAEDEANGSTPNQGNV
jgi:hypothetical protein